MSLLPMYLVEIAKLHSESSINAFHIELQSRAFLKSDRSNMPHPPICFGLADVESLVKWNLCWSLLQPQIKFAIVLFKLLMTADGI